MATMTINFVSNRYDDNGKIKVSVKKLAFPENVTLSKDALQDALQDVISSHRIFLYENMNAIEGKKAEPNEKVLNRLLDAIDECDNNTTTWTPSNTDEYRGVQLLAYSIDNAMHRSYRNNKPVSNMPEGGMEVLEAFRDYKNKRVSFGNLKNTVIEFAEGLNNIPFLKDRTIKLNDADITELVNMYLGIGQVEKWKEHDISGRRITKCALLQQIILKALKKSFKFAEQEKTATVKVVTF